MDASIWSIAHPRHQRQWKGAVLERAPAAQACLRAQRRPVRAKLGVRKGRVRSLQPVKQPHNCVAISAKIEPHPNFQGIIDGELERDGPPGMQAGKVAWVLENNALEANKQTHAHDDQCTFNFTVWPDDSNLMSLIHTQHAHQLEQRRRKLAECLRYTKGCACVVWSRAQGYACGPLKAAAAWLLMCVEPRPRWQAAPSLHARSEMCRPTTQ